MTEQFTKEEAVIYLGEVFQFKEDFQETIDNQPQRAVKAGEVGKVTSVDCWTGDIKLSLDVYGNYYSVDKQQFEYHCQILRPEIIACNSSEH